MYIVIKEALGDTNTDTNFSMLLDADTLDKNNNNNNNKTTTTTQSLGKRRRQQQQRPDDFSDWPDNDHAGNFKRIPKNKRTTPIQGFYAGLENTNSRENGIFKANVVQPYPPVPQSGITHIGDRNALYTTGQLESGMDTSMPSIQSCARQPDWVFLPSVHYCANTSEADGPFPKKPTSFLIFGVPSSFTLSECNNDCPHRISADSPLHKRVLCRHSYTRPEQTVITDVDEKGKIPTFLFQQMWHAHREHLRARLYRCNL